MWILDLLFCWIALNLMWVPTEHELSVYQLARSNLPARSPVPMDNRNL